MLLTIISVKILWLQFGKVVKVLCQAVKGSVDYQLGCMTTYFENMGLYFAMKESSSCVYVILCSVLTTISNFTQTVFDHWCHCRISRASMSVEKIGHVTKCKMCPCLNMQYCFICAISYRCHVAFCKVLLKHNLESRFLFAITCQVSVSYLLFVVL